MDATIDHASTLAPDVRAALHAMARHRGYLYRYALTRVRERETAEELVQDTLLAALEGHAPFRGASALQTWLAAILKHKIVDWYRREKRSPICELPARHPDSANEPDPEVEAQFDSFDAWLSPPSAWPNPERALENSRFWQVFERCLEELPPTMARTFHLREVQGLSVEEICAELHISKSNCWVMLHRARVALRSSLEARWFQSDELDRRANGRAALAKAAPAAAEATGGRRLAM